MKHTTMLPSVRYANSAYYLTMRKCGYIYAMYSQSLRRWKFGVTSVPPGARTANLRRLVHDLELFGHVRIRAPYRTEVRLKTILARWKVHGEWFSDCPETRAIAMAIRSKDTANLKAALVNTAIQLLAKAS